MLENIAFQIKTSQYLLRIKPRTPDKNHSMENYNFNRQDVTFLQSIVAQMNKGERIDMPKNRITALEIRLEEATEEIKRLKKDHDEEVLKLKSDLQVADKHKLRFQHQCKKYEDEIATMKQESARTDISSSQESPPTEKMPTTSEPKAVLKIQTSETLALSEPTETSLPRTSIPKAMSNSLRTPVASTEDDGNSLLVENEIVINTSPTIQTVCTTKEKLSNTKSGSKRKHQQLNNYVSITPTKKLKKNPVLPIHQCPVCFTLLSSVDLLRNHIMIYHSDQNFFEYPDGTFMPFVICYSK